MHTVFARIYDVLRDILPVYPSFDAVPVEKKPREMFLVLDMRDVQFGRSFLMGEAPAQTFTAEIAVSVLTPLDADFRRSVTCFYESVMPALRKLGCTLEKVHTRPPEADLKLRRLVFSGTFTLSGVYRMPDQETEETA